MPIDNPTPNGVQGDIPPTVPTVPNPELPEGLSSGLQTPGGITVPGSNITDTAPPQPQANPQHFLGRTFGKVLSGLSGGHNEYSIDPTTGQTITTPVKESPGQTFRSILALGLMGGQGIGPKEGQMTFTQGLLAGLGGGVRESTDRKDFLDKQRRQQAQEQYANQLRAAQEERENKKLTMEEQLNQVAIADHNQNIAYRKQVMDEQAYNYAKQKGIDAAEPLRQNSVLLTEADKPKIDGYKELNVDPLATGLTLDEVNKYIQDHPGATTKEMGFHTGTRMTMDPKTGAYKVEDLYSVYPAMTKVPPSMLQQMKVDGADSPKSTLHAAYLSLIANKDGNIDVRKLLPIYRDMQNWENLQKSSLDRRVKEAEIFRDYQAGSAESVRMQLEKLGLKEKEDQLQAENLFRQFYDVGTNDLKPNAMNLLQPGQPDPISHKGKMSDSQAASYRDLLQMALTGNYEATTKDFYDHYKPTKDAYGNYVVDDAQAGPQMAYMNGLRKAQGTLAGRQPEEAPPDQPNFIFQGTQYRIPGNKINEFLSSHPGASKIAPSNPLANLPNTMTLVQDGKGNQTPIANDALAGFLKSNPDFKVIAQGQGNPTPSNPDQTFTFSNK